MGISSGALLWAWLTVEESLQSTLSTFATSYGGIGGLEHGHCSSEEEIRRRHRPMLRLLLLGRRCSARVEASWVTVGVPCRLLARPH
jgi:hypothetical protein